jgi:hypothetical protein
VNSAMARDTWVIVAVSQDNRLKITRLGPGEKATVPPEDRFIYGRTAPVQFVDSYHGWVFGPKTTDMGDPICSNPLVSRALSPFPATFDAGGEVCGTRTLFSTDDGGLHWTPIKLLPSD